MATADAKITARTFADLVDALLPGDEVFPKGSTVGVQALLADRLRELCGEQVVAELCGALEACQTPPGCGDDETGRDGPVSRLERSRPELFDVVLKLAYLSYYESPAVHEAIRALGFSYNAAPLPAGYPVGAFDPSREAPRHGRGRYLATAEVRRVDLGTLDFLGGSRAR